VPAARTNVNINFSTASAVTSTGTMTIGTGMTTIPCTTPRRSRMRDESSPQASEVEMNDELNDADLRQMHAAHAAWTGARAAKDWQRADRLRKYLQNAGCMGPDYSRWNPVFEETPHRRRRLKGRHA
jgi:cysteinyl-tRNA synthetase